MANQIPTIIIAYIWQKIYVEVQDCIINRLKVKITYHLHLNTSFV